MPFDIPLFALILPLLLGVVVRGGGLGCGVPFRYLSVCSGIEAASVAWKRLGWQPAAFSEIEAFPRKVLEHHYKGVPLHGDFTTITKGQYGRVDLLVGGTPCQDVSIAGPRAGFAGERSGLAMHFLALAGRELPRWIVWENVVGTLSSRKGRDFGAFLGQLGELGYGWSYRVLDAQYFGVPQQRRRVIVVAYLGDWGPSAKALFERDCGIGDTPPGGAPREGIAPCVGTRPYADRGNGDLGHLIVEAWGVRRFSPLEWERLQGFPDNYTLLPGGSSDTARYRAVGNSMPVPMMRWLGERISDVETG